MTQNKQAFLCSLVQMKLCTTFYYQPIYLLQISYDLIWYDSEAILHLMKRAKFKEGNFSFPNVFVKLLALALTNLVLSLVNLVTNLAKPSLGQPSY